MQPERGPAIAGIPTAALSQSINGGTYVDLVIVGEQHPTVAGEVMNILPYINTDYATASGGFAVNFHDAAPVTGTTGTAFGITSSTGTQQLGKRSTLPVHPTGRRSQCVHLPNRNGAVYSYQFGGRCLALSPSQIDSSGCAANTLPCNSGSLSLYYIDGPAASLRRARSLSRRHHGHPAGSLRRDLRRQRYLESSRTTTRAKYAGRSRALALTCQLHEESPGFIGQGPG